MKQLASSRTTLTRERILMVSPQPWQGLPTSKVNYALTLVRRGCEVYFLDPPSGEENIAIDPHPDVPGLHVVRHGLGFPYRVRFHLRPLFDWLMKRHVRQIMRQIPAVDIVWCFDANLYRDLRCFGADRTIFHPVDPLAYPFQVIVGSSADIIFSVSPSILRSFTGMRTPRFVIGHGLSEPFAILARSDQGAGRPDGPVRVGYIGNLGTDAFNWPVVADMVRSHPGVEFHFWGPHPPVGSAWEGWATVRASNVILHGAVPPAVLAAAIECIDIFFLAYRRTLSYDKSNSHKILEYLSTGKPIISSRIETYVGRADLVIMTEREDDSDLPSLLTEAIDELTNLMAADKRQLRKEYALSFTYDRQVERIATHLARLDTQSGSDSYVEN